ncbi:MAG: hypothetical protein QMC80_03910 [Thermoplasmatales archaeon]|nr:hypothetical protein [Thermoplasmatales archaeon]
MNVYDVIISYLTGAVVAVVTAVAVKIVSSKVEKQLMEEGYAVEKIRVEKNVSAKTFRCPKCRQTFTAEEKMRPYKVRCPFCGTEGMIK